MKITLKDNGIYAIEATEDELWFLSAAASNMYCELCEHKEGCGKDDIRPYCKRLKDTMDDALFGEGSEPA